MKKQALIIFFKNPEAGKVKTRLAATIGNEAALAVYKQLVAHTVSITSNLAIDKAVFYSEYTEKQDVWSDERYIKKVQSGNDLGGRMSNAFTDIFFEGYNKVVLIGTDCPELNEALILEAFAKLDDADVVIGPALDGGYYLIALKSARSYLFEGIEWSTPTVLRETLSKCKSAGLQFAMLQTLRDVDEEKDLSSFKLDKV